MLHFSKFNLSPRSRNLNLCRTLICLRVKYMYEQFYSTYKMGILSISRSTNPMYFSPDNFEQLTDKGFRHQFYEDLLKHRHYYIVRTYRKYSFIDKLCHAGLLQLKSPLGFLFFNYLIFSNNYRQAQSSETDTITNQTCLQPSVLFCIIFRNRCVGKLFKSLILPVTVF